MGVVFLVGYIVFVGLATFLLKFGMKDFNPFQINLLMGLGMLLIGVPALWLYQKSLSIPHKVLPLGSVIGLLMAAGSILFILALSKLPAGLASAVAGTYVVVVIVLSWIFLDESLDLVKILGLVLTLSGVAILSFKA